MTQKLRNRDEGFTIIEVLIVLAIAGLILLIIFLAVPALQRSSRNTQRKNDAAAVGGAIANFISNNGGVVPVSLGKNASNTNVDVCATGGAATGGSTACTGSALQTAKMGYYIDSNVSIAAASSLTTPTPSQNTMVIETGENCDDTNTKAGSLNPRTAAIFYAVETGSNTIATQCVEQ